MKVVADTNLLVRLLADDDRRQHLVAKQALSEAELVAVTVPSLCELVWVLSRRYGLARDVIADAIRDLADVANVTVDRPAVAAGLAMMDLGGDFADGVIAHQGRLLGGDTFLSFDQRAVRPLEALGAPARLLS